MEQLDLVYNTFANLERNYSRSKKTRTEYITDKFGGNIQIGSFLILNALSAEEFSDPEDIRKFSEVRSIFDFLLEHQDTLDSLQSFDMGSNDDISLIFGALSAGQVIGTGIEVCSQRSLYTNDSGTMHYDVSARETLMAPVCLESAGEHAPYVKLFNRGMLCLFGQIAGRSDLQLDDILMRKNLGMSFEPVDAPEFD